MVPCSDGVALINLLHQLYRIPLPFYHMQPTSKIHALDNMVVAFQMLEQATGTGFPFVKPASTKSPIKSIRLLIREEQLRVLLCSHARRRCGWGHQDYHGTDLGAGLGLGCAEAA